jgi:hypothetical protein
LSGEVCLEEEVVGTYTPTGSRRSLNCRRILKQYRGMQSALWCLSVAGVAVGCHCLGAGRQYQPQPGWCLIPWPPHYPCVMEVEQGLGFTLGNK